MDGEFICKIAMLDHLGPLGESEKNKNKNHFCVVLC